MNEPTDSQLLKAYAEQRSEADFSELVRRHVDHVYSAALRMVCDSHLAQDVTQGVFLALAKNAAQLVDRPILSGWLHRTAQNIAAQTVRADVRRRAREQEASAMNQLLSTDSDADWKRIAPQIDAALSELNEPDRDALLLRYFERKSAREIAARLGISDEAAQKRVNRAVERLRELFAKRGVTIGASSLVVALSANCVQAAPAGLIGAISAAAALAESTLVAATATTTATEAIAMTTLQKTIIGVTLAAAVGTAIYEARLAGEASSLQAQLDAIAQQQSPFRIEMEELTRERNEAASKLAALQGDSQRLISNNTELLKLRGEVSRLRNDSHELSQLKAARSTNDTALVSVAKSWASRAEQLKAGLKQMPDKGIPEVQLLDEKEWLEAVKRFEHLGTETEIRQALSSLRSLGKQRFAELVRKAFTGYAEANEGQLPTELSQLKPYFSTAVDDAVLQRYQLAQTGKLNEVDSKEPLIVESATPVDNQHDTFIKIRMSGTSITSTNYVP